ncbi:MAG TPA: indolepyruvate ferredoxin oxidoreductase subunit alpha [Nevskiaceae bacterium]
MAERSFKGEVKKLRLGKGDVFHGEGIMAITKALLESGVSYVGGYQGAPISHLMDVFSDASDILAEYNVRFENSANEAAAAAMLSASVNYPLRGAVTFKTTVGTNVAADALSNLSSGGVTGGALIILGEDYGEGSSIMQERSHAFAMKSQMWLLDPRPNLTSIVKAVKDGFELSEATNTPVMMMMRIRSCHLRGTFVCDDNRASTFTPKEALEHPVRDLTRIVLPPASFQHEVEKIEGRWPRAVRFIQEHELNEFISEDAANVGIVTQGGSYNAVNRALHRVGLSDMYGNSKIPIFVMNCVYPLVDAEFERFCKGKRAILIVEEGQPNFIEQNVADILRQREIDIRLHGKDVLPLAGDYNVATVFVGVRDFLVEYGFVEPGKFPDPVADVHPVSLFELQRRKQIPKAHADEVSAEVAEQRAKVHKVQAAAAAAKAATRAAAVAKQPVPSVQLAEVEKEPTLDDTVQGRPPGLCTGCPERPIFTSIMLVEEQLGVHHIASDIGCNLFSIMPPFNLGNTTMGYGLSGASSEAFNVAPGSPAADKRAIAIMGDGGFWHNGLTTGIANAVFNRSDNVTIIVDNNYAAATGGQDIPSTRTNRRAIRDAGHAIEDAVKGVGVKWVRTITRTYDLEKMTKTLREALTTHTDGPKVIIAQSECMLNKQRRVKPLKLKAIADGKRVVRERFGVDSDTCTGDHSCIRLSGCPSLTIKENPDPLREDPVTTVLDSCVGCGHCGEMAHAAVLCPSFYKASIVNNPTPWDKLSARMRMWIIAPLQAMAARRRARFAF